MQDMRNGNVRSLLEAGDRQLLSGNRGDARLIFFRVLSVLGG